MLINGSQLNMLVYVRWLLLQERVPDGFRDQSHCTLIIFYISSTTGVVFLPAISSQERSRILLDIANALQANERLILAENEVDVAVAQQAGYEKTLISRLALKSEKISSLAKAICVLANMEEPIGRVIKRTEIASLAIRSGNGLLLKGGKEAKRSNTILHKVITSAIPQGVGEKLIGLVTSKEEIPDLLKLYDVIDLVIPRGSNKLVSQIKASTKIPVLGHAGVTIYGGRRVSSFLNIPEAHSFCHEYSSLACTVEIVDDVSAAIEHIHHHGSAHTDCIVTEDYEIAEVFLRQVDSAAVFHNASIRFCDGFRFGLGAEVGISIIRIHAHGSVGVEGLLTTCWIVRGNGQIVDGDKGVVYTHKELTQ